MALDAHNNYTEILLRNSEATENFGRTIASRLREGDILNLVGELGAGKTTLTKGVVGGLGGDSEAVTSPTFSLVHEYHTASLKLLHCDFYRLEPGDDLADLGGLEFFFQPALFVVEWLERLAILKNIDKNRLVTIELQNHPDGRICRFPSALRISEKNN